MQVVIGPILKRAGGYAFDTWDAHEGINYGFAYHRIEDAIYARKATIKDAAQDGEPSALLCQTIEEFHNRLLAVEFLNAA